MKKNSLVFRKTFIKMLINETKIIIFNDGVARIMYVIFVIFVPKSRFGQSMIAASGQKKFTCSKHLAIVRDP